MSAAARGVLTANQPARRRHRMWRRPAAAGSERDPNWVRRVLALAVLLSVLLAFVLIAHLI